MFCDFGGGAVAEGFLILDGVCGFFGEVFLEFEFGDLDFVERLMEGAEVSKG